MGFINRTVGKKFFRHSFTAHSLGVKILSSRKRHATVGGNTLATLLKRMSAGRLRCKHRSCLHHLELDTTVFPFILNGINLQGVGSSGTPMDVRVTIWEKLATDWYIKDKLPVIAKEVTLEELNNTYNR